jgi:hypothetical protein
MVQIQYSAQLLHLGVVVEQNMAPLAWQEVLVVGVAEMLPYLVEQEHLGKEIMEAQGLIRRQNPLEEVVVPARLAKTVSQMVEEQAEQD